MKSAGRMVPYLMRMLTAKPNTVKYPFVPAKVADRFRGALKFHPENCVGCKMCQRVCPAQAIEIEKVADKQFKAVVYMDRCIFCGQCVDSCVKKALENTEKFELASLKRESLKTDI